MSKLTVLQHNILLGSHKEPATRIEQLKPAYKDINPDVILLQEVDESWYEKGTLTSSLKEIGFTVKSSLSRKSNKSLQTERIESIEKENELHLNKENIIEIGQKVNDYFLSEIKKTRSKVSENAKKFANEYKKPIRQKPDFISRTDKYKIYHCFKHDYYHFSEDYFDITTNTLYK